MDEYCFCFGKFVICFSKNGRRKSIKFDWNANELSLWIKWRKTRKKEQLIYLSNDQKFSLEIQHRKLRWFSIFHPPSYIPHTRPRFMRLIAVLRKIKPNPGQGNSFLLFFCFSFCSWRCGNILYFLLLCPACQMLKRVC